MSQCGSCRREREFYARSTAWSGLRVYAQGTAYPPELLAAGVTA